MGLKQGRQDGGPTPQSPSLTSLKLLPCNKCTPHGNIRYKTHILMQGLIRIELVTIVLDLSLLDSGISVTCDVEVNWRKYNVTSVK